MYIIATAYEMHRINEITNQIPPLEIVLMRATICHIHVIETVDACYGTDANKVY